MKLSALFAQKRPTLSFECFPPKTGDAYEQTFEAASQIASLQPDYMSVTYGAGGSTSAYSIALSAQLQDTHHIPLLAHLTCVNSSAASIHALLDDMKARGIENILALRGDMPKDATPGEWTYRHASELMTAIRQHGDFCIGGACYPETHTESATQAEDIRYLKEKVDCGCEFLTTQMFFDNNLLYNFMYKIREAGILVPIVVGIMPVTQAQQLGRIVSLSGTQVPQRFRAIVDHFGTNPEGMKQAGIAYATEQIIDLLANGIKHIHVYSMNKPDVAAAIQKNLSAIL